jgi:aspartate kinase
MIVMKFGGTSVENASAMRRVREIILRETRASLLVVLSACAGVTNALLTIAGGFAKGDADKARQDLALLKERHWNIAESLLVRNRAAATSELALHFDELERALAPSRKPVNAGPELLDYVASFGERWSSILFAHALQEGGAAALWIDARSVVTTNNDFTHAAPLFDVIESKASAILLPLLTSNAIVVTQGFVGSTADGVTTTLGRGGSDYSAAILGAALNAEEIQIWTDVDGILTSDPSIVRNASLIKEMTFDEASELAYFGARVLHPSTILPAMKKNIPVRVLNSRLGHGPGTLITAQSAPSPDCIVKSIAYKEGITMITIRSSRMLMAHGFLANVFGVFEQYGKSIDVIATSEVGVSLTIDDDGRLSEITRALGEFADVRVDKEMAVLCVVGENMKDAKGMAGRVFQTLGRAGVNIELISFGGSEINLTFVIREDEIENAVRSLHGEFFGGGETG